MFVKDYEFRYGDLDVDGNIRIASVLDVLQDVAGLHSDSVGYDSEKLSDIKIAWLLEGWRLRFDAPLHGKSKITVKTGILNFKSCESHRGYEVWQDDVCKVVATADWFTVNTEKMRVARIPAELIEAYDSMLEADNGLPYERFKPEQDAEPADNRRVEVRDLDTNRHMNNVRSAEVALSYLPEGFCISELAIRYTRELKRGDEFTVCCKELPDCRYVEFKNPDGAACVMIKAWNN